MAQTLDERLIAIWPRRAGKKTRLIASLKSQARDQFARFFEILDRYDCGADMLKTFNVEAGECAGRFNRIMEQLETLDPDCPKGKRL